MTTQKDVLLNSDSGWLYQCRYCGHQVTIDAAFPEKCPGCGAGGWWGHLVTLPEKRRKHGNKKGKDKMPGGVRIPNRILSQENNAMGLITRQNKSIAEPVLDRGRGRPCQPVPEDLIKELDHHGLSSRAIAAELGERGIEISYKTVQRRLQGSLL